MYILCNPSVSIVLKIAIDSTVGNSLALYSIPGIQKHIHTFSIVPFFPRKFYVFESRFILPIFLIAITFLWIPAGKRGAKLRHTHTDWPRKNGPSQIPFYWSHASIPFVLLVSFIWLQTATKIIHMHMPWDRGPCSHFRVKKGSNS